MTKICLVSAGLAATPAVAQETTTYTYDALGRVIGVSRTGGPSNGSASTYTYDPASNRTSVTVTGSPNGSGTGAGAGAGVTRRLIIVVPLNGLSVIVVN